MHRIFRKQLLYFNSVAYNFMRCSIFQPIVVKLYKNIGASDSPFYCALPNFYGGRFFFYFHTYLCSCLMLLNAKIKTGTECIWCLAVMRFYVGVVKMN